jgi:mRNA-degrading endonuclease YafQ of YafQ-DinJ toxin-antitoxin module
MNGPLNFKRTPHFRRAFDALPPDKQEAAREAFALFKVNPFDPRLKPHKINRLSSLHKRTVWSVSIGPNLRAVFCLVENNVISLDIGDHAIYE